ncbi:enoyl-CoA hydratase/isomerase family protein [soil metagenome]
MTETIRLDIVGGEARLTLANGSAGNALTLADIRRAREAIAEAVARPQVRVLRLCAEGESFCVGRLAEAGPTAPATSEELRTRLIMPILDLYRALHALDIVSVAQVQGDAHGLGCALVSACDIAVAASHAKFTLPEMSKDLPPTLALSALGRKVHAKAAASLVLGMATFDAQAAMRAGLVGEVVQADALAGRVDAIVAQLSTRNAIALATVKRYLRATQAPDFDVNAELAASLLAGAMPAIRASKA